MCHLPVSNVYALEAIMIAPDRGTREYFGMLRPVERYEDFGVFAFSRPCVLASATAEWIFLLIIWSAPGSSFPRLGGTVGWGGAAGANHSSSQGSRNTLPKSNFVSLFKPAPGWRALTTNSPG